MDYKLIITDEFVNQGIGRLFNIERKDQESIDSYNNPIVNIPSMEIEKYSLFLEKVINEDSLSIYEYSGFNFGPITEAEKVWLEDGLVEIYVMDAKTILTKRDFFELALEFANKALEALTSLDLKGRGFVDDRWITSVKEAIPKLEAKLKNIL